MANVTVTVLEADGVTETDVVVLDVGRQAAAASKSLVLSTEDKTALDAAVTALQLIDNAISGSEMQVDVLSLPASTNTIEVVGDAAENAAAAGNPVLVGGRYDATDRTLGDGDVGAIALTADGIQKVVLTDTDGNLIEPASYAEDSPHSTGDSIMPAGAVRANAKTTGMGADGDYVNLKTNNYNELYVSMEGAYETVAASATAQALGATGATGDIIHSILVIPATTSPGNVLLLDNATSITVFAGGASSVADLKPFSIPLRAKSVSGAWKITTGANVSCVAVGNFT